MKKLANFIGLIAVVILVGCDSQAEEEVVQIRPALVMTVGSSDNSMGTSTVLVGEVKSRYESNQSFRIQGKIIKRMVEVGDTVKKGQVLARLDPTDNRLTTQAANADVLSAKANYELAKAEVERQRKLVQKKFISQSALDLQEAKLKTSLASLKQAQARAAVSNNQSKYTALVADRSGVIKSIQAEPGQVVEAGQMIAVIADVSQLEVLAAVPESGLEKININDMVAIKLWANQAQLYQGKVREITPAASEATRAFDVRFSILDPDAHVKLGMTAGVRYGADQAEKLLVPSTAVTEKNGKPMVWLIDHDQVAHATTVDIGPFNEQGIVVKSGLKKGDMIAIAGVHTLVDGQKVKPTFAKRKSLSD